MGDARKRARRGRWGLAAAMSALFAASAIIAGPAAANPPDPTRPDIELSVRASIDRPFTWKIEKTADVDDVTLEPGETATVNYSVTVIPTEGATGWSAFGEILVYNKELDPVMVNSITNVISGVGPATVTCQGDPLPRQLNSGAQIRCRFTAALPDNADRVSTATASVGASEFTASAPVEFATALDNRIDHCVAIYDSMLGLLDEQTCVNKVDKTVEYSVEIGPYEKCGRYEVKNTAWAITNHTETRVEDSYTVDVRVPCEEPCKDKDKYDRWHGKDGKYGHKDECDDDDDCDRHDKYDKRDRYDGGRGKDKCRDDHDDHDKGRCGDRRDDKDRGRDWGWDGWGRH
jgi:hypothetical protein